MRTHPMGYVVASMLVATTMVAVENGPAVARQQSAPLAITLQYPNPRVIWEDNSTSLSGRLHTGSQGAVLTLQRRHKDGTWTTWARTTTRTNGVFTFRVHPTDPGDRVVRVVRATAQGPQMSNQRWVRVKNRSVSIGMNTSSYQPFDAIVVHGEVTGKDLPHPLKIQRYIGGRWQTFASVMTGTYGGFYKYLPNNVPGTWKIRVIWPGEHPADGLPDHGTMEYSGPRTFTVATALHPVVTQTTREQLGGSYHDGCPVGPSGLRNVQVNYWQFDRVHLGRGTLVVRASVVGDTTRIWGQALAKKYPFRKIYPTARYGGDDIRAMWVDDTSAFNCRKVTGDPTSVSPHSYGTAYDINTVENPYMDVHGTWWPRDKGYIYRDRSTPRLGMLYRTSAVTEKFDAEGFFWGGLWYHPDYQHFQPKSGASAITAAVPATSGPLDRSVMPDPQSLGAGWARYADPGGPEQGFTGNATFVRARDTAEVGSAVLPLGCAQTPNVTLPRVAAAVEGSYRSRAGNIARLVVMQFATRAAAADYFAALGSALSTCRTADGPTGMSVHVTATHATYRTADRFLADGSTWAETDVVRGNRVAVLLTDTGLADQQRLTTALTQQLK